MQHKRFIITIIFLLVFPFQCCFAQNDQLAPASPFLDEPDSLDRVLDVVRLESLSAQDWDRLTVEELTELIKTLSEIVRERERIYENEITLYESSPGYIQDWREVTQEGRERIGLLESAIKQKKYPRRWLVTRLILAPVGGKPFQGDVFKRELDQYFSDEKRSRQLRAFHEWAAVRKSSKRVKKVLIVDDEQSHIDAIIKAVRIYDPEIIIVSAHSGEEAWNLFNSVSDTRSPFDAVITDFSMRQMFGITLATKIKNKFPDTLIALNSRVEGDARKHQAFDEQTGFKSNLHGILHVLWKFDVIRTRNDLIGRCRRRGQAIFDSPYLRRRAKEKEPVAISSGSIDVSISL